MQWLAEEICSKIIYNLVNAGAFGDSRVTTPIAHQEVVKMLDEMNNFPQIALPLRDIL